MEIGYSPMRISRVEIFFGFFLSILSLFTFIFFYISQFLWQPGWFIYGLSIIYWMLLSLKSLYSTQRRTDIFLFSISFFFFLVLEPFTNVILGKGFPLIRPPINNIILLSNFTGIILSSFSLFFYFGAFTLKQKIINEIEINKNEELFKRNFLVYSLAFFIPLFAFFGNGGGLSFDNLISTISARSEGYVAFASSALGNESAFFSLMAACTPIGILLFFLYSFEKSLTTKFLLYSISIFLFSIYALAGSRSSMVLIIGTIFLYLVTLKKTMPRLRILITSIFLLFLLFSIQINFRNIGFSESLNFKTSGVIGFNLNTEVSFIVDNFDTNYEFISGDSLVERIIKPIPETMVLFFTNPIPRFLWENKPFDNSFAPYNLMRTGFSGIDATSNITATIPGRYYMKYGLSGVIQIAFLFGLFWSFINRRLTYSANRTYIFLYSIISIILVLSIRDLTPGKFYPLFFFFIFYLLSHTKMKL